MKISNSSCKFVLTLLLILPVFTLQAAPSSVMCDKKSLADVIGKLEKSKSNTINITGDCNEDIVISGHQDLTLIGLDGASITATVFDDDPVEGQENSTVAVFIDNSNVTLQDLTINGGVEAAICMARSVCEFRDVTIPSGWNGVSTGDHSKLYIYGSSLITNLLGIGVAGYTASHIMMGPDKFLNFGPEDAGPVINGNWVGVWVQDGSFFRSDNVTITGNDYGIFAQRNATLKVYNQATVALGVSNNTDSGIWLRSSSTAHIGVPINDNGGDGIRVGPLSLVHNVGALTSFSNNGGAEVNCAHTTAVDIGFGVCP